MSGGMVVAGEREAPLDYALLAEQLTTIGSPSRLELLDVLRFPKQVSEIRLRPTRNLAGENPDRSLTRQAIQQHLDKLVETGLVRVLPAGQDGREVNQYAVHAQKVWALVQEMSRLSVHYARGSASDATGTLAGAPKPERPRGPRLTLVHGAYEGKSYPLTDETAQDGRWIIGRKRGLAVALDYDPFVSVENAVVLREGDGFVVSDLPESKNGTLLNWERIPKGASRRLEPADVIGVGSSLLSYAPR